MRRKICWSLSCCVIFLFTALIALATDKLPSPFTILPLPQKVVLSQGKGMEFGRLKQLVLKGNFKLPVMGNILSALTIAKELINGTLTLVLDSTLSSIPSAEGYILSVAGTKAVITAKGPAGLFYGCQSLEQLLEDARDYKKPVPLCTITDYPVLSYRAVHFDVKHHLDHMNYYYESIDRLARYKINAVVFEFEDKLRYQRQPIVAAPQAISIDEMAALTRYARDRNIEITPLVQGLGHATFILKHPQYASLRELPWNKWAFCPLHEGTYQVLFDLYRDAIDATPGSKYLHIGGDEIGNIGLCPRCKPTADKEGMLSLSLNWLKKVCAFAKENGRIPIFWDDMPLKEAGVYESTYSDDVTAIAAAKSWQEGTPKLDSLLKEFPANCVYMRWNYTMARQPGNILALEWYKSRRLQSMIATATNAGGGLLFQEDERDKGMAASGVLSIRSFIQLAAEKNIDGMLCTAWDDASPHMENYWQGFIAAAEYSWFPTGRTPEEYDAAWLQKEFGIAMPGYVKLNSQLRAGSLLWYEAFFKNGSRIDGENALQGLSQVEHWLPPLDGHEKKQVDCAALLIDLPNLNSPGIWSLQYKDRLKKSQLEVAHYPALLKQITSLYNSSTKNRYHWQLALAMYELQMTAPRLLLALKEIDISYKVDRAKAIFKAQNAIINFKQAWHSLQQVYAQTRFIANPSNYVPDRYFHFASQREDLSWMVQPEEKYHAMIEKWMQDK